MKMIVANFYSLADYLRYVFLGKRDNLSRPIFLYNEELRPFIRKYGQNGNHYSYQSKNIEDERVFLKDYFVYLSSIKPSLNFILEKDMIIVRTKMEIIKIFFYQNNPCFSCSGLDGSSGAGGISLSLEYGLLGS